jgi:hypothetical protein
VTREQLSDVLAGAAATVREVARNDDDWFAPGPPKLELISPLAEGADRTAAVAALEGGYELRAVLPFARSEYAEDFAGADSRRAFATLLERATCVLELPGDRSRPLDAYLMAGRATVAHCDILLAVWDGLPARGRGGTGEIVAHALARGRPVIHLPVDPRVNPAILWSGYDPHVVTTQYNARTSSRPLNNATLADLVQRVLAPPSDPTERSFLRAYIAERERRLMPRVEYPLLVALTGIRAFRRSSWRAQPYAVGTRAEWSIFRQGCTSVHGVDADLDPLEAAYAWSDRLATHFAQAYRSGHVFNFTLGAFAVLIALSGLLLPKAKLMLALAELAVIMAVIANTHVGTRQGWHRRWLDYRQLAERLRPMRSLKLLGLAAPDLPVSTARPRWIDWYAAGLWRAIGLPSGKIAPDCSARLAAALAEHELAPQIAYHHSSAREVRKLDHRLHLIGTGLFIATVLGCLALVAGYLAVPNWTSRHSGLFVFLSAGLPALGTALFGIRTHGDFAATAHRSSDTAHRLEEIAQQLGGDHVDLPRAGDLFEQGARTMLVDLGEWRLGQHQRELQLP